MTDEDRDRKAAFESMVARMFGYGPDGLTLDAPDHAQRFEAHALDLLRLTRPNVKPERKGDKKSD